MICWVGDVIFLENTICIQLFLLYTYILETLSTCVCCESSLLYLFVRLYFTISFNRAIRFKGYQQQDSHELLRYLLDGMRAEEIQVNAKVIVVHTFLLHTLDPDSSEGRRNILLRCVSFSWMKCGCAVYKRTHRKSGFGVCVGTLKNILKYFNFWNTLVQIP